MKKFQLGYVCRKFILLGIFFTTVSLYCTGQTPHNYRKAIDLAEYYYLSAKYQKAAQAYEVAFTFEKREEHPNDRLWAAASNCMINNEKGVKENLFAIIPISRKKDVKRVLVSYAIFDKYKHTDWWKELESILNNRINKMIAHHKNLHIFRKGRNFVYRAIRMNAKGDTLANTTVTIKPSGTGWMDEANPLESQVVYEYEYSQQDSLDHIGELQEVGATRFWKKRDTTRIIENMEQVWMPPLWHNEFFKAQVTLFPQIHFIYLDKEMNATRPRIRTRICWKVCSYTESRYESLGKEKRSYAGSPLSCYKFEGRSKNAFHGASKIEYYFNKDYGFVEMKYETYDHDIIHFLLDKIIYEDKP